MEQPGVKVDLKEDLQQKVIGHRNNFVHIMTSRYYELLPQLIDYRNKESIAVDFLKLEVGLRNGYEMVIGEASNGKIVLMGYVTNPNTITNAKTIFNQTRQLQKRDIKFIIPDFLIPDEMREITYLDDCQTGNFVVMRNKVLNYTNDYQIIDHFVEEMAEITTSRFSIIMQLKIMTFFISENGDESVNEIVSALYNGSPFAKVDKFFDPDEQMLEYHNDNGASNLVELKREYQNKISELNNLIGIQSIGVEKESGVSDTEAQANKGVTFSNANVYLSARQQGLDSLNKRFGLEIEAIYNDEVSSELSKKPDSEGGTQGNEQNSNNNRADQQRTPEAGQE